MYGDRVFVTAFADSELISVIFRLVCVEKISRFSLAVVQFCFWFPPFCDSFHAHGRLNVCRCFVGGDYRRALYFYILGVCHFGTEKHKHNYKMLSCQLVLEVQ